jgi:hypothetical protein
MALPVQTCVKRMQSQLGYVLLDHCVLSANMSLQLTRLLEDSLGGSSKTLLVVNCSPAAENANESKCSLDFAARARKVELGAAQRNVDTPGSPGSPSAGGSSTPRMSGLSPLNTGGGGGNGGSTASSPRVNRNGGDLSSTARLAASRRAGGLQQ